MGDTIVRLQKLEMWNIKNVGHGEINLSTGVYKGNPKGSILGIYGQNGSGKTVVVDSLVLLKQLLSGRTVNPSFAEYIRYGSTSAVCRYSFLIQTDEKESYVEYEIELLKTTDKRIVIEREKLSHKPMNTADKVRLSDLFKYKRGEKVLFTPLKYFRCFEQDVESRIQLGMAQQFSENFNEEHQRSEITSFLFASKAQEVLSKVKGEAGKIYQITSLLQAFGRYRLAVIKNSHNGLLALNLNSLPVNVAMPDSLKGRISGLMVKLTDVNVIPKEVYPYFKKTIEQINIVLSSLVPELTLDICNNFEKFMEDGSEGVQFELTTIRGEARIPLLHESAGIKKIISIGSNLVACYNQEGYCLVVDELDSGIYEYLLGEYLEAMQEKAKGQLIFTSHNLRPLEVLENDFLAFTTTNPEDRYLKISYIKNTQNTRLSYMRAIKLGGQKEKLYQETNLYEIELAMKAAGRVGLDD